MNPDDLHMGHLPAWPAAFNEVPKWCFEDEAVYQREIEHIFKGPIWHLVAHVCELPRPGDFKTAQLGRTPLLLVHGDDGEIRAFYNTCTHRGTLLEMRALGHRTEFECPYHRWLFDTRGDLRACPGEAEFPPGFDRSRFNLARVHVRSYLGLVFVSLADEPLDFDTWLGELAQPLAEAVGGDGRLRLLGYQKVCYQSNWKIYMDNDAYHAPLLHAAFRMLKWQGGQGSQRRMPEGHWLIQSEVESHLSEVTLLKDPSVVDYRGGSTPRNKGPGQGAGSVLVALWPLTGIANHLDMFNIRYANPVGIDKVEVHFTYFAHADDDDEMVRHRLRQSSNMIGPSGFVSLEDATVFQRIQRALDTRPGHTYFLKGWSEDADLYNSRQNDEAPNAVWWEVYRQRMGFERGTA